MCVCPMFTQRKKNVSIFSCLHILFQHVLLNPPYVLIYLLFKMFLCFYFLFVFICFTVFHFVCMVFLLYVKCFSVLLIN